MARVAREMVERAGVDVNKLLDLLVRNASAELTSYYYYPGVSDRRQAAHLLAGRRWTSWVVPLFPF